MVLFYRQFPGNDFYIRYGTTTELRFGETIHVFLQILYIALFQDCDREGERGTRQTAAEERATSSWLGG